MFCSNFDFEKRIPKAQPQYKVKVCRNFMKTKKILGDTKIQTK